MREVETVLVGGGGGGGGQSDLAQADVRSEGFRLTGKPLIGWAGAGICEEEEEEEA